MADKHLPESRNNLNEPSERLKAAEDWLKSSINAGFDPSMVEQPYWADCPGYGINIKFENATISPVPGCPEGCRDELVSLMEPMGRVLRSADKPWHEGFLHCDIDPWTLGRRLKYARRALKLDCGQFYTPAGVDPEEGQTWENEGRLSLMLDNDEVNPGAVKAIFGLQKAHSIYRGWLAFGIARKESLPN